MAHYAMSDTYGEADGVHAMLDKIRFLAGESLYIFGDVIDRGPDESQLPRTK